MHFLAYSGPADGVTPEQLTKYIDAHGVSSEAGTCDTASSRTMRSRSASSLASSCSCALTRRPKACQFVDSTPVVEKGLLRFEGRAARHGDAPLTRRFRAASVTRSGARRTSTPSCTT